MLALEMFHGKHSMSISETLPTRFAAAIAGLLPYPPPADKRRYRPVSELCWLCGGEITAEPWPREKAIPQTFASFNEAACLGSDAVCQACAALAIGETWQPVAARLGLKTWATASWRSFSHFFAAPSHHECPDQRRWRDILLAPPEPPFLAIISLSQQKNLIFRGEVARDRDIFPVLLEEEKILLEQERFTACLSLVEEVLSYGVSYEAIRTGRWHHASLRKLGPALYRRLEGALGEWRQREPQVLQLVAHVAARPDAASPETESETGKEETLPCVTASTQMTNTQPSLPF